MICLCLEAGSLESVNYRTEIALFLFTVSHTHVLGLTHPQISGNTFGHSSRENHRPQNTPTRSPTWFCSTTPLPPILWLHNCLWSCPRWIFHLCPPVSLPPRALSSLPAAPSRLFAPLSLPQFPVTHKSPKERKGHVWSLTLPRPSSSVAHQAPDVPSWMSG